MDAAIREYLDPSARDHVVQLNLAGLTIKHTGPFPNIVNNGGNVLELFCDDARMDLSRWPNEGEATMAQVLARGDSTPGPKIHGGEFVPREDRVARCHPEHGVWLEGYYRVPCDPETVRVKSIDPLSREITLAERISSDIGSKYAKSGELGNGEEPWCAVNKVEVIDKPGEWSVDFEHQTVYFWLPNELAKAKVYVSDFDKPVISVKDASFGGTKNVIAGCTFRNLGRARVLFKRESKTVFAALISIRWGKATNSELKLPMANTLKSTQISIHLTQEQIYSDQIEIAQTDS